jgi:hypothetical protein
MNTSDVSSPMAFFAANGSITDHLMLGAAVTGVGYYCRNPISVGAGWIYNSIEKIKGNFPLVDNSLAVIKTAYLIIAPTKIVFEVMQLSHYLPTYTLWYVGIGAFIYAIGGYNKDPAPTLASLEEKLIDYTYQEDYLVHTISTLTKEKNSLGSPSRTETLMANAEAGIELKIIKLEAQLKQIKTQQQKLHDQIKLYHSQQNTAVKRSSSSNTTNSPAIRRE